MASKAAKLKISRTMTILRSSSINYALDPEEDNIALTNKLKPLKTPPQAILAIERQVKR